MSAAPHEFDVLHCHLDYWPFSLFSRQTTPFLTTLHGRLDLPELQPIYECFRDVPLVSISDAQRAAAAARQLRRDRPSWPAGRPADRRGRSRRATWRSSAASARKSGPIAPSASPARAGMPLKIAAKVDRVDEAYFDDDDPPDDRRRAGRDDRRDRRCREGRRSSAARTRC